eukprot:scaffold26796_cov30-Tisochrysis_lutea.AAC.4
MGGLGKPGALNALTGPAGLLVTPSFSGGLVAGAPERPRRQERGRSCAMTVETWKAKPCTEKELYSVGSLISTFFVARRWSAAKESAAAATYLGEYCAGRTRQPMRSAEQPPAVQNASALSRRLVGSGNCLQANGSPKGIVDEIPGNLRKIASPRDGLDIAKERPARSRGEQSVGESEPRPSLRRASDHASQQPAAKRLACMDALSTGRIPGFEGGCALR